MDRFVKRTAASSPREPLGTASANPRRGIHPVSKRLKTEDTRDTEDDLESVISDDEESGSSLLHKAPSPIDGEEQKPPRATLIETSLPAIKTDKEAIDDYEAQRASQLSCDEGPAKRLDKRSWVRGKSSIYVDAFNLALDTVLEDESALFDEKEKTVFARWQQLSYEAQYLYVRLFLRKTSAWHRVERLGYYGDISDVGLANASLLERHELKAELVGSQPDDLQPWHLGDSFTFADSEEHIDTVREAAPLLNLDELKLLAKEAKVKGKNKSDLLDAFCRMSSRQSGLLSMGLSRSNTTGSTDSRDSPKQEEDVNESNRDTHFLTKILAITGPLIRLSESPFRLFERVHLVFYRSTEWTEKSLTTIILAKISKRTFPEYIVCRSANIFASRRALLEFEDSMRKDYEIDSILDWGPLKEDGMRKVLDIFDNLSTRWRELLQEEQRKEEHVYEFGEGSYLRRLNAAHAYTRIAHKAAYVLGRLKQYREEHALLTELLGQRLFHFARRGSWYQRKALLEEHYMWEADPNPSSTDIELQKKHWRRIAVSTCEAALEDRDCHVIFHYDLQKRIVKLEKRLRIPRRLQHDFGHVKLRQPEVHTVQGIQLVRDEATRAKAGQAGGPSTKTMWLDELGDDPEAHVSVEAMTLSYYRSRGWKGYHAEGGIVRTLFAYLFYDILFLYIPNVFQTEYQTCPLDLHTDAFYATRASEINHRLVEIANGEATRILEEVDTRERARRTCVVGLNWDYDVQDLRELVSCFEGSALAAICKVMAQEYGARGGGIPDLLLWRTEREVVEAAGVNSGAQKAQDGSQKPRGEVLFAEVKSENDRLSDTQRLWIHVLTGAGVRVALCHAVAKEVREIE